MSIPLPDEVECYWVLPGQFLAGEYPAHVEWPRAHQRLDALLAADVDSFFDLTQSNELRPYFPLLEQRAVLRGARVRHARFPIRDLGVPTHQQMLDLLDSVDAALASKHSIYVHCWGGVGRTGLTVACWLVRHGRTPEQALQLIAEWRSSLPGFCDSPQSPETAEQVAFVRSWHEAAAP